MSNNNEVDLLGLLHGSPTADTRQTNAANPFNNVVNANKRAQQSAANGTSNSANPFNGVVVENQAFNSTTTGATTTNNIRGQSAPVQQQQQNDKRYNTNPISTPSTPTSGSTTHLYALNHCTTPTNTKTKLNLDDETVVVSAAPQQAAPDPLDILLGIAPSPQNGQKSHSAAVAPTSTSIQAASTPTATFRSFPTHNNVLTGPQPSPISTNISPHSNYSTFTANNTPTARNNSHINNTNTIIINNNKNNNVQTTTNSTPLISSTPLQQQQQSPSQIPTQTPIINTTSTANDDFFDNFFDNFTLPSSSPAMTPSQQKDHSHHNQQQRQYQQQQQQPQQYGVPPQRTTRPNFAAPVNSNNNISTTTTTTTTTATPNQYQSNSHLSHNANTVNLPHIQTHPQLIMQHDGLKSQQRQPPFPPEQQQHHPQQQPEITEVPIQTMGSFIDSSGEEFCLVEHENTGGLDLDDFLFSPAPHHRTLQETNSGAKPPIPTRKPQAPTRPAHSLQPRTDSDNNSGIYANISTIATTPNPALPPRPTPTSTPTPTDHLNVEYNDDIQFGMVSPGVGDSNSSHKEKEVPVVLPCLYTVKSRPAPVGESTVETSFIDVHKCHLETCAMVNKLARHSADICTCGGVDLPLLTAAANKTEFKFAKDPNADHDFNVVLGEPHGSISSTQCTIEEKNKFLQNALFSSPPAQINEPAYVKTFALTFNHYETTPTPKTVSLMLPANPLEFNIYCFSFQECGNMVKNQAPPSQVTTPVITALNNACKGTAWSYKLVACERVMSLFTFVIARIDLFPYIHRIHTNVVTTGLLDLVGNKGAAIVRFFVKNTAFAIVGCHFNAGQSDVYRRNGDYHKINAKSNLGMADTTAARDPIVSKPLTPTNAKTLLQCTHPHLSPDGDNNDNTANQQFEVPSGLASPVGQSPSTTPPPSAQSNTLMEQTKLFQQTLNNIKLKYKYNYVFAHPRLSYMAHERIKAGFKFRPSNTVEGRGVHTFTGSTKKDDVYSSPEALYELKSDLVTRNDVVIWMGDLNYRIAGFPTRERVFDALHQGKQTALVMRHDQLLQQKDTEGTIFHGFREGAIAFPPSYKYDLNTQQFDTSQKSRTPGWTDRILYIDNCSQCFHQLYGACDCNGFTKGDGPKEGECVLAQTVEIGSLKKPRRTHHAPCQKVLLERYGSIQQVVTSDHRPVFAYFYINVAEGVLPQ